MVEDMCTSHCRYVFTVWCKDLMHADLVAGVSVGINEH